MFDNLQHSLISLGKLCDENFQVMLDKNNLYAFKNEIIILQGNRSCSGDGLWDIPITMHNNSTSLKGPTEAAEKKQTPFHQSINVILCKDKTAQDSAKHFHATCFYPISKTVINFIKRNLFSHGYY